MDVQKIEGVVKEYDWGNSTFLPSFLGTAADGKPKAEYWMGTHREGDATVVSTGEKLSVFLKEHQAAYLGAKHVEKYGPVLPLLFKVLAIGSQLSIQCHPTDRQAKAGWAREAELRAREKDSGKWNYKDERGKAEVVYALTPMTAMCGFRPFDEALALLSSLMPKSFATRLHLKKRGDEGLGELFTRLSTMEGEEKESCLGEYLENVRGRTDLPLSTPDGLFLESRGIVMACRDSYPDDPGLFCPFLLNVIHLEAGEALYLEPGTLHAYVKGNGLELMSASDNVLRGGLTRKKVDVPELLSILTIHGEKKEKCGEERMADGSIRVVTPDPSFALFLIPPGSHEVRRESVELLLSVDGDAKIQSGEEECVIRKGECFLKGASLGTYRTECSGRLFSATLGA